MSGPIQARRADPPRMALERVIGISALNNAALSVNPVTGDIAYAAGCIVTLYSVSRNKQIRFFRTKQAISSISFSADGEYLAAGTKGRGSSITVWAVSSGLTRAEFGEYSYGVATVSFTHDNKYVIGVGYKNDRSLHVWDWSPESGPVKVASGRLSQKVVALSFVENSYTFVTAGEKHLKFWDLESILVLAGQPSSQGQPLALTSKPAVMSEGGPEFESFVDVACGRGVSTGNVYALTSAGMLCVFDVSERLMEQWVSMKVKAGFCLDIVNDNIFVGCSDGIVRVFSLPRLDFKGLLPLPPAIGKINVSTFDKIPSPRAGDVFPAATALRCLNGTTVATVYGDHSMFVWDVRDLDGVVKLRSFLSHSGPIWDVQCAVADDSEAFPPLPAGTFVTCSTDSTVRFWNLNAKATLSKVDGDSTPAVPRVGEDESMITLTQQTAAPPLPPSVGSIKSPTAGVCRGARPRNAYMKELLFVTYIDDETRVRSSSNTFLSGSGNEPQQRYPAESWPARSVITSTYDTESGLPTGPLLDVGVRSIALRQGNNHIAAGDRQGNIHVIDVESNVCQVYEVAHDAEVLSVAFSQFGRYLATGSRDRLVHIFDSRAQKPYSLAATLADCSSSVTSVKFTPNGHQFIAAGSDATVHFYKLNGAISNTGEASKFELWKSVNAPHGTVYDMDVDVTSKNLTTTGQDKRIHVWALRTCKLLRCFKPENDAKDVNRVCFDPSGLYVAAASADRTVSVFDFFTGKCLAKASGHADNITGLAFTPDCRRLITVSADGCIFVWRLSVSLTKAMLDRVTEIQRMRQGADGSLLSPPNGSMLSLGDSTHPGSSSELPAATPSSEAPQQASPPFAPIIAKRPVSSDVRPPTLPPSVPSVVGRSTSPITTRPVPAAHATSASTFAPPPLPQTTSSPAKPRLDALPTTDASKPLDDPPHSVFSPTSVPMSPPAVVPRATALEDLEFRQSVLPAWARPATAPQPPAANAGTAAVAASTGRPASKWASLMTASKTADLFAATPLVGAIEPITEDQDAEVDDKDEEPASVLPVVFHKPLEDIPITRDSFSISVIDRNKQKSTLIPDVIETIPEDILEPASTETSMADSIDSVYAPPTAISSVPADGMRQSLSLNFIRKAAVEPPILPAPDMAPTTATAPIPSDASAPASLDASAPASLHASAPLPVAKAGVGTKLGAAVAAKLKRPQKGTLPVIAEIQKPIVSEPIQDVLSETAELQQLLANARLAAEAEAATAAALANTQPSTRVDPTALTTTSAADDAAVAFEMKVAGEALKKAVQHALELLRSSTTNSAETQSLRSTAEACLAELQATLHPSAS